MAVYKKLTGAGDATLLAKGSSGRNNINKILITNADSTNTTVVRLYIDDDTNEYNIVNTKIPPLTSLVLEDNLKFNAAKYDLKTNLSGAGYDITIIIQ